MLNTEKHIWKSPLLIAFVAFVFIPALIGLFIISMPIDERRSACLSIEWELQNAAQCLTNPHMWAEWSKIGQANNSNPEKSVGEIGCPIFIEKIKQYGFMAEESALLSYFVESYDENGGVAHRFKKETGRDFCEVAEEKGWITKYLSQKDV